MTINIEYPKQFSKEYKDFIIVLSKISELKNIKNLPFKADFLNLGKNFEKIFQNKHFYESYATSNYTKSLHNIKIVILQNNNSEQSIIQGSKFSSYK